MSEQLTGIEQEKPERTRESEIKANVEFWKGLVLEGIEINEDEIRAVVETLPKKEGLDWYLAFPKGIKMSEVWQKMAERYPNFHSSSIHLDDFEMTRDADETFAVASRYTQEPDENSLGKNAKPAEAWEETGETYMSPLERAVADMRWYAENGTHLDERNITMCPGSRTASDEVPGLRFRGLKGEVSLMSFDPGESSIVLGVRQVITKNSETEEETPEMPDNTEKHRRGNDVTVKVVLIRHGEKVITQETVTTALTDEGREQAKQFGQSRKEPFLKAYYSPTERTEETARIISESSPSAKKGVPVKRKELSFGFKKGGEFIGKVQEFRKNALVPEAEGLSPEEIEKRINQLKEESPEEFNKRLKTGADQHTEFYLNFGPNKPEAETSSPAEIAARISKLLLHYIKLSKRLYSRSEVDLINVTHDVNIATFLVMILRESRGQKELNIGDIGGSIEYTEDCEVVIHRENEDTFSLKLLFRGQEYDIDEEVLQKLANAEYEE